MGEPGSEQLVVNEQRVGKGRRDGLGQQVGPGLAQLQQLAGPRLLFFIWKPRHPKFRDCPSRRRPGVLWSVNACTH